MGGHGKGSGKKGRKARFSFSQYLLFAMMVLVLVIAAGITYFDYGQAEAIYHQNARAMQAQTEEDITQTIRVVDAGYEIFDSSLNLRMRDGFRIFLAEYELSGRDPSQMDLQKIKEDLGNTMDLYIINESMVVEYTTYPPDIGLDFSRWPHSYNYLRDIIQKEGFFPDRVVYEVGTAKLRKYAYMPTPDHRYLLELGMNERGIGERPKIQYQDHLRAIAFHNPAIIGFRAFDTVGREIGNGSRSKNDTPVHVRQVIEERRTIEVVDPVNRTLTRYLFVDLANSNYAADTSWIIELVYDQSWIQDQLSDLLRFHALVALGAVLLSAGIGLVLSRRLTRPISRMVRDIDTISRGDLDHTLTPLTIREFAKIEESVTDLVGKLKGMIEQLQQREMELQTSEENYRTVVENQTELIARFLPDGTHIFVNEAYCRYFGKPCQELLGTVLWPHIPDEDRSRLRMHFAALTPESPKGTIEHRIITPDGEVRWLQWNDQAIFSGDGAIVEYLSVGRDITEKWKIGADLVESERKFRDLAGLLPQVIFETDLSGRITYVNQAAYAIFGYEPEDLEQGINISQVIRSEDHHQMMLNFQNALNSGKLGAAEYHMVRKDGSVLVGMVYSSPIVREGAVVGIRGILVDITQLKQVEEDLRKLNEELEQRVAGRTQDLEEANRELEAFSYSVSHDLRAPLRAIDGFSSILLSEFSGAPDPKVAVLLERIRMNAQKMGQLIDAILNFSRMSRQPLSTTRIFPAVMVDEILAELQPLRQGRAVEVLIGDLPPCKGDPALVRQVFFNLIANAFKFTRTREQAVITIGSFSDQGRTVYFVRDNGVGFDMRYVVKLFSVFQRLHDEKEYEGTGIGLAIVHRIIERHGGKVWAEGEVDRGASFYFTLE